MGLSIGTRLGPYRDFLPTRSRRNGRGLSRSRHAPGSRSRDQLFPASLADTAEARARFEREAQALFPRSTTRTSARSTTSGVRTGSTSSVFFLKDPGRDPRGPRGARARCRWIIEVGTPGAQIADALDPAHRGGLVHRDLADLGNVMIAKSGAKLMDFGIARMHPGAGAGVSSATGLPTETAPLTAQGGMLGTIQYMAPEVLEGHPADARSDIFAFGALVYEMATGRRAFDGASHPTIIAAILNSEPPLLSTLQPLAPPALEHLVVTCVAKDPDERWQSAADVKRELLWISQSGPASTAPSAPRRAVALRNLAWLLAGAAVSAAAVMLLGKPGLTDSGRTPPARFEIRLDDGWQVESCPAISGDGTHIAYVAKATGSDSEPLLYVRALDTITPVALAGTAGARPTLFLAGWSVGRFLQAVRSRQSGDRRRGSHDD